MAITKLTLEPESDTTLKDKVVNYSIDFDQNFDKTTGETIGSPILEEIVINITRIGEAEAPFYLKWQLNPSKMETLNICFYNDQQLVRTIKMENAYLVSYNQTCHQPGRIDEELKISTKRLHMEGEIYDREDYQ